MELGDIVDSPIDNEHSGRSPRGYLHASFGDQPSIAAKTPARSHRAPDDEEEEELMMSPPGYGLISPRLDPVDGSSPSKLHRSDQYVLPV